MTDPGFIVQGISQADLFRPRAAFAGYHAFGDQEVVVLIGPDKAEQLRAASSRARPRETGGLLSGRTLRDGMGSYVVISSFVEAQQGAGKSAAFYISPQEVAQLKNELARRDPTGEVVGWWHSHLRDSAYSPTDLVTQRMFTQPKSVGLLMFAACDPWARVYLGPAAEDLGYSSKIIAGQGRHVGESRPAHSRDNGQTADGRQLRSGLLRMPSPAPGSESPEVWHFAATQQRVIRLGTTIGAVLLLILLAILLFALSVLGGMSARLGAEQRAISGQIASGDHKITTQITRDIAKPKPIVRPSVSFSCSITATPGTTQTSASYYCTAKGSASGEIVWLLDNHHVGTGATVTIPVRPSTTAQYIDAILQVSGRDYPGSPITIPAQPK